MAWSYRKDVCHRFDTATCYNMGPFLRTQHHKMRTTNLLQAIQYNYKFVIKNKNLIYFYN